MSHQPVELSASHPQGTTRGRTISWGFAYDHVIRLLTLNRENALRASTLQVADIHPGDVILDVGCGTGTLTLRAKTKTGQEGSAFGIDASPQMIEVARRKASNTRSDVTFKVGVIEALDFADDTFDVVLSSLMMHHLPEDVKQRGLMEIRRVLKPNGSVLIVDFENPANLSGLVRLLHHDMTSDLHKLIPMMQAIGFTQVESGNLAIRGTGYIRARRPGTGHGQ